MILDKKENHRKANKKWYQKQKAILHRLKINGCAICGYNKYDACLDFHHVNPEDKKFTINLSYMGKKDLVDELNKCILFCVRCHREIHEEARLNDTTKV
jgi:hypothetical protein